LAHKWPHYDAQITGDETMRRLILTLATAVTLGAMSLTLSPAKAAADEYWDGYWGWYDNTYSPYYTRRYYSEPYSYGPYNYGPSYGSYPGGAYYSGRPRYYGGDYYGTPNFGYRDYPGAGQVRVGPLRFGWR
jgi:hypothetical protein